MKKISLLLLALVLCTATFAQLPNGSIAPNFTATDLNGNTWTLYDILDQGKSVVLNISATWAGPCWNYSQTGALQDFYEQHGPDGDNTAMVLWVEGDVNTLDDCITNGSGCGPGNSQGDFTAGQTYPFIDDDGSIMTAYEIAYFPTIFLICSDKILNEAGQVTGAQLGDLAADCPVITSTSKLLLGSVVQDANANCTADNGETALANWGVTVNGQNGYSKSTVSNASGNYKIWVDSLQSPFTIVFTPPSNLWGACQPFPVVTPPAADTFYVDHAATALIDCPQLSAEIGAPFLRRCFGNQFNVEVCNNGTETAIAAYVDVSLQQPEFLPIYAASAPYTTLAPGVYRFDLGDIASGACVDLNFWSIISCDSTLIGQTLCFEAHAYPDTLCEPTSAAWNGASVSVEAECENGQPQFSIKNEGSAPMLAPLEYVVIEDDVMRSEGVFQLNPGESLPINVQGNGSTWRVEALQVENHPIGGSPSASLEGCTVGGAFTMGFMLNYATFDPSAAHDVECMEIIGSWDPNDKTGFPLGATSQNLILKNTDLDYLIRFQNTGTDTAFTVVVRDTLSANLNPASIRLGASSHAYEYALERGNIMVFTFKDIKLVDSFANEPASHGFLRFKIAQQPNLADGKVINNRAAIYFDFNPPVITNTTEHRIGKVPHVSSLQNTLPAEYELTVYPNPLNGSTLLRTANDMPPGTRWTLYDFSGRRVASGNMNGNTATVGSSLSGAGLCRIEFVSKDGRPLGGATLQK